MPNTIPRNEDYERGAMDQRMATIEARTERLEEYTNKRLDSMDQKMDVLDAKVDSVARVVSENQGSNKVYITILIGVVGFAQALFMAYLTKHF